MSQPGSEYRGENFYKEVFDLFYDGVYFVDRDRTITYWNKAAERLIGYLSIEVCGRPCHDNILVHTDAGGTQLCHTKCPVVETINDGRQREKEVFLRHRDGHRVSVLVRVAPIRDGHGAIAGAIEVFCPRVNV